MIIEVKINICKNKYGADLANTELKIDSDHITQGSVSDLVSGMVASALQRAQEIEQKEATKVIVVLPPVAHIPADNF